jgi:hypothetical protein
MGGISFNQDLGVLEERVTGFEPVHISLGS